MENFGIIKEYVTKQLTQSLLNENVESNIFNNFIKEIKKSDILKTQYVVYSNLENKYIKDENKATRYINENINLFKKFNYKDLLNENKKLSDKFSKLLKEAYIDSSGKLKDFEFDGSDDSSKYFKNPNPDIIKKAEYYGLVDIENENLTPEGLIQKMIEWDEGEHGVEEYIYDMTKKDLERQGYKMPDYIRRGNVLDENKNNNQCPCTKKLYENLDILIKESLKDVPDPEKKYNSYNNVLEYVMTEDTSKQEEDKYKLKNETYFPDKKIIEMAINKFNDKYSFLNENEREIFTVLFNNDNNGKQKVFEKIKKNNINQIKRKLIESSDEKLSDKLKLVEEKLSSMAYNKDNYIDDMVKLNKLSLGF